LRFCVKKRASKSNNDDSKGRCSVLVAELPNNLAVPAADAEAVFNKTRIAILRGSDGEQSPSVSSSLLESVQFTNGAGGPAKGKGGEALPLGGNRCS
jgi:hypothetical protein